jgi:phage recombination protein Bet
MNELTTITPATLTPELVKQRVCPEATDQEIFLFLQIAKSCNLNPFLNQIYLVKYGGQKATILTSYNVYLQRAERSGSYGGLETSTLGSVATNDLRAVVKVFRKDWEKPLVHEVWYEEYVQKTKEGNPNRFWKEKPRTMIVKVAISQAFRLAFPLDFEGMPYTQDEMPHEAEQPLKTIELATNGEVSITPQVKQESPALSQPEPITAVVEATPQLEKQPPLGKITEKQGMDLLKMAIKNGYTQKEVKDYITDLGYKTHRDLNEWDLKTVEARFRCTKAEWEKERQELEKDEAKIETIKKKFVSKPKDTEEWAE